MEEVIFKKYHVIKPLGEGATGSVFLVRNLHLNRQEALKICADTPETMQMLSEEAKILQQLSHPMLPAVYDLFSDDGKLCMVMEYVEGMTLETYLSRFGPVEEEKAIRWAVSLTEVLEYLHSRKPEMIYRDLKPSNIMVLPDGNIRLIDLGAAHTATYGLYREELLMGTPGYSAPEQWQGGCVCKESDVYALGMVLHEMLTALCPVSGCQERRPIREYDRSISGGLEQIIMKCIAQQPKERYHSMEQLRSELTGCSRTRRRRERGFRVKQGIGRFLFAAALARTVLPFLWGVDSRMVPFPYFKEPLFLFGVALGYRLLFMRKKIVGEKEKLEKSIFLTEKKYPGLFAAWLMIIFLAGGASITAAGKGEALWVEMRDESGRKCLLREGSVFRLEDKMWFELTKESLPPGVSSLQLIAVGEEKQVYESRVFFIENN